MPYLDDSVAKLTYFERAVPWMYRDTNGYVTVGVGDMLPIATSAQELAFVDATGTAASTSDILTDYQRVASMTQGMVADAYHSATSLHLPDDIIASSLLSEVKDFDNTLNSKFGNYATFPDPAKLGLLDMIFNLGAYKLFHGFPTFIGYVGKTDWANAAGQCHRIGPGMERNVWTVQQFNQAAALQTPS